MPRAVACAVVRDDPPRAFIAEDQETLNWILALMLIAQTPSDDLPPELRDQLRATLTDGQWGAAVELWVQQRPEVDVYSSFDLYTAQDVASTSPRWSHGRSNGAPGARVYLDTPAPRCPGTSPAPVIDVST
jgi:hypothetical protein